MRFSKTIFVVSTAWVLGLALPAVAANQEEPCKLEAPQPDLIHYISGYPSYFAKISADGRYMYYIGYGNRILDLEQPNTEIIVPGPYDPVPAPPTGPDHRVKHFTVPSPSMQIFDNEKFLARMKPGETVNLDDAQPEIDGARVGSYQSMGTLEDKGDGKPTYRILSGSLTIGEYKIGKGQTGHSRTVCDDNGRYQLPMLSKDGKYIAAYDSDEGVTKIMEIQSDNSCKDVLNLGFPTGKVEFAYDGSAVTFHADSFSQSDVGNQFGSPSGGTVKNVYVLDLTKDGNKLKAGALRRITDNSVPGHNSYYPSFTLDGKVAFIHGEPKGRETSSSLYSFRRVPFREASASAFPPAGETTCREGAAATFALGGLMQRVCTKLFEGTNASGTEATLWALSLQPEACQKLVSQNWQKYEAAIKGDATLLRANRFEQAHLDQLTKGAVAAVCPKRNPNQQPHHPEILVSSDATNPGLASPPEDIFLQRCQSCHDGANGVTKYEWNKLNLNDLNRMLIAIQEGAMPRGNLPNRSAALQPLVEALLQRQGELQEREANAEQ